jgi:hypothetical protein
VEILQDTGNRYSMTEIRLTGGPLLAMVGVLRPGRCLFNGLLFTIRKTYQQGVNQKTVFVIQFCTTDGIAIIFQFI